MTQDDPAECLHDGHGILVYNKDISRASTMPCTWGRKHLCNALAVPFGRLAMPRVCVRVLVAERPVSLHWHQRRSAHMLLLLSPTLTSAKDIMWGVACIQRVQPPANANHVPAPGCLGGIAVQQALAGALAGQRVCTAHMPWQGSVVVGCARRGAGGLRKARCWWKSNVHRGYELDAQALSVH